MAAMKVLVLGANGQLGSDIMRLWRDPSIEVVSATRADADVTDAGAVAALVERTQPDADRQHDGVSQPPDR